MFFDNLFSDFDPFRSYTYRQPQRRSMPYYNDNKTIILRKLINDDYNYICFDCHKELNNLDYFDIKNGIFLCYNCAQKHVHLPKDISLVMTGNIRSLEENDLMILYYGGNKNLIEFIKRHFPLLENYNLKEKYSTKAMDYYRKLLRSKAFDEEEPELPNKKQGYNSIFYKKISPTKENTRNKHNNDDINDNEDNEDDNNNDIFSSTFFGDDLFGRRRNMNQRKQHENNNNNYMKTEPADISVKTDNKKVNHKVKNNSHKKKKKKKEEKKNNDSIKEEKNKKIEKVENTITINQIGELSRYPDAMEIDGMECE